MDSLPAAAAAVWKEYQAMAESKEHHLNYLRFLEQKYPKYGGPDDQENAEQSRLLKLHDINVKAFRGGLARLRIDDPKGYGLLVAKLSADI